MGNGEDGNVEEGKLELKTGPNVGETRSYAIHRYGQQSKLLS